MTGPATRLQQKRHTHTSRAVNRSRTITKRKFPGGAALAQPARTWPALSRGCHCRYKYSGTHCTGARSGGVDVDPSQHTRAARGNARRGGWRQAQAAVFGGVELLFFYFSKQMIQYSVEIL
jgi:hypothetical protein